MTGSEECAITVPTWQVLTGNTGVSGQMQALVSLCSDGNAFSYATLGKVIPYCAPVYRPCKPCGLLATKDLEF